MRDADRRPLRELARQALASKGKRAERPLGQLGFTDPGAANQIIERLSESGTEPVPLPAAVLESAVVCARPDSALRHFERFANATGAPALLFRRLGESERLCDYLLALLGHSALLTDILVRNPEYLYWLLEESPHLTRPLARSALRASLHRDFRLSASPASAMNALRLAQRRELLRIGAAEILGLKDVAQIGAELTDLADLVLDCVLETAWRKLTTRFGIPRDDRGRRARFCIVGLGKFGGGELNFSSDIDLIFVYDGDGYARARKGDSEIDNVEFFTRLGEALVQELTRVSEDGFLYRVDMRLRPDGLRGPLVRSMRSYWVHYETRGELWERQMLIKARRAAGSIRLWTQFQRMLLPFLYPGHLEESPQREIRHVKQRIEANVERSRHPQNIKLRPGGIRDIEFVVQCLQLLSGGLHRQVRTSNTLEAISRLSRFGALDASEADTLRSAYRFLRRLENLLQIASDRAIYEIPDSGEARAGLAAALDLADGHALDELMQLHLERVRAIYDVIFFSAQTDSPHVDWLSETEAEQVSVALESLGFHEPDEARRTLIDMSSHPMMTELARRHFTALLPQLLAALGASPDPHAALARLRNVIFAYGAPGTFFDLLRSNANFRRMLAAVCGTSQYLSDLIVHDPSLLDHLVMAESARVAGVSGARAPGLSSMATYRNRQMLRIGAEDLLGLASIGDTFLHLSELADSVFAVAFGHAWREVTRRRGRPRDGRGNDVGCACFSAGKYGGQELNFGSDLDVFFVYGADGETGRAVDNHEFFSELARELIRLMGELAYEVDTRLRPEGRRAPIVISLAGYRRYLKRRAIDWERLALSRARPVVGDPALCGKVQRAIREFLFRRPLDAEGIEGILDIHARMKESVRPDSIDIKRGLGGIADIEFAAQALLIARGKRKPGLVGSGMRALLVRLVAAGILDDGDGQNLITAYDRYREAEKGFRMMGNRPITALPDGRELESLARTLGAENGENLKAELARQMRDTRVIFDRIFTDLAGAVKSG